MWVAGTQALSHFSAAFPRPLAAKWFGNGAGGHELTPIWDASIAGNSSNPLTHNTGP